MPERGETLSDSQLAQCKPIRGEGGKSYRAFCPFHGGDRQRSLRVEVATGRFQCFACGVWGYLESSREEFRKKKLQDKELRRVVGILDGGAPLNKIPPKRSLPGGTVRSSLQIEPDLNTGEWLKWLVEYRASLPGSPGAEYLEERGIPLELAESLGVGYAKAGQWAHRGERSQPVRDYRFGRLVFPHTDPAGEIVNLYGRAIGDRAPKALRHDHLPGNKGYFHGKALASGQAVYVCEGPFDALSLMAAMPGLQAVAIFGVRGWRMDWSAASHYVFALDADPAGQAAWRELARALVLRGKKVDYLPAECYGGAKDANEAWVAGTLRVG